MAACGSFGLNYLPLDGNFSDNNKQSMISSEYGIVVVYLTTHRPKSTKFEKIIYVPLKQNCRSTVVIPGNVRAEREGGGEGETTCVKGSFVS